MSGRPRRLHPGTAHLGDEIRRDAGTEPEFQPAERQPSERRRRDNHVRRRQASRREDHIGDRSRRGARHPGQPLRDPPVEPLEPVDEPAVGLPDDDHSAAALAASFT